MVAIFKHNDIVQIARKWILKQQFSIAFAELVTQAQEQPDVIAFNSYQSIVIECKVSRSDFLRDRKKPFRINPMYGMGMFRFYCCPENLIRVTELPDNWGLLYVDSKGKIRIVYNPYCSNPEGNMWYNGFENYNQYAERQIMFSALRRIQNYTK